MLTQQKKTLILILCFVFLFLLPDLAWAGRSCNYDSDCTGWAEICWNYGGSVSECVMGKCCKYTGGCTIDADCQDRRCLPGSVGTPSHCEATRAAPPDLSVPSGGRCSRTMECEAALACIAGTCGLCNNDSDCYGKSPACVDSRCSAPAGLSCALDEECERRFPGQGYICSQNICTQVSPPPATPTAPTAPTLPDYYKLQVPTLQIPVPGLLTNFSPGAILGEPGERYFYMPWIGEYVGAIYKYTVGVVGILATVMIIWAGILWLTAAGSPERINLAKEYISGALIGLVLAFGSYLILYTMNPDLVKFEAMKLKVIERIDFEATVNLTSGGFDADGYTAVADLSAIPGDSPAAKAAALCVPDPENYEGRIASLRTILPQWLAICQNGCAYVKGGNTNGCASSSAKQGRMLTAYFCTLKKNNRPLPPGCENIQTVEDCREKKTVDGNHPCGPALQQYYHTQWAVPLCNAGMIIGDCITWSQQLLRCAGKVKHPIYKYSRGGLPASEYLVFEAQGIDDALAKINAQGGLKFGDLIWSDSFGHNFMFADGQIVDMGGFNGVISVPGVGQASRVGATPFNEYISRVRGSDQRAINKAREKRQMPDIKTYIFRPYAF